MSGRAATARDLYEAADRLPRSSAIRPILFRRAAELSHLQDARIRVRAPMARRHQQLHLAAALERATGREACRS